MRKSTSVALLSLCLVFLSTTTTNAISPIVSTANTANPVEVLEYFYNADVNVLDVEINAAVSVVTTDETAPQEPVEAPVEEVNEEEAQPVVHTVEANESLSKISKEYDVDWQRIYAKNTSLENPNLLEVGEELTIPEDDEELELRELPTPPPAPVAAPATTIAARVTSDAPAPVVTTPRGNTGGNTYYAGYCTWYVKSKRPDLPNNLGNANTWLSRAAAQGYATGSTPRVGAVAYALTGYMHVAIVESVNADGTVTVSEMNFTGFNQVSTRTAPANQFSYIY